MANFKKMKKKKVSQRSGVLVCTAIVFVILFFNQFKLIDGTALAEEKTSRSGTVWAMNAQDLLANRKRREGEEEVAANKKGEAEEKLRINNPRKKLDDEASRANQSTPTREIYVKLPQNIGQMMPQSNDRQRMREAMLGFPPMPMPNSNESQEPADKKGDLGRENDDLRTTTPTTENKSPSGRRKNTHPQQTRQNGRDFKNGESDFSDQTVSTVTQGTEKTTATQTTKSSNLDFEGAVWDGPNKMSDKSDEGFSKKEPTNSRSVWSIAWEAHVYFSGTLFVLLSIYCSVNILRLHTFSRLFSRGYFVSLNLCLVVIGLLRPIWLFHDPYNFNQTWPRYGAYLLVDTGLPCMTTAFAVLFLALLRTTMIELVSPSFQTPGSLAIFCGCHFLLSFGVDITIGMFYHLRYMVLILQGVFIVWSLLLSAGYFYIFSAMNKVALRQQGDMLRSVYPKLILEGTVTYSDSGHIQPISSSILKKPPLARAVHLTLGVAILGSLLGGVQLFGMIKMLGLLKEDMTSSQNEWAWYGYQVSMRILEVTLCTLLAVIATTPLRSNFDLSGRISAANGTMMDGGMAFHHDMLGEQSLGHYALNDLPPLSDDQGFFSRIFCCCRRRQPTGHRHGRRDKESWGSNSMCCTLCTDSNPPREFEDEIYSEICSNNHSVRQVMSSLAGTGGDVNHPFASTLGRQQQMSNGQPMGTMLPLGTLNTSNHLAIGSNTLLPYKRSNAGVNHYPSQSQTLLRSSNNYHDGGQGGVRGQVGVHVQGPVNSIGSSRATLDTALYSNVRSRPSSMLFNDSGFVRFRMGPDHGSNTGAEVGVNHSNQELDRVDERNQPKRMSSKEREGLRASQSFDESVLLMDMGIRLRDEKASPASQPEISLFENGASQKQGKNCNTSPVYNSASDQELRELDPKLGDLDTNLKDTDSDSESDDDEEEEEGIYEPAPGTKQAKSKQNVNAKKVNDNDQQQNVQAPPSESDEPIYSGKSIYGRAPSQCSSVSATQSFDMRMYGRIPQPANQPQQHLQQKPNGFGTLQKNEKLENPYYYYGSTRNQKKQKQQISKLQKPRPLLPSQRQALEFANRTPTFTSNAEQQRPKSQMDFQRPSSRQALLPQYHQEMIERQQRLQQQQQQLQQQIQLQQQQQQQLQHQQQQQQLQQQQQQNFQRSRSLGHHYQQQPQFFEPVRNQQILNHQQIQQPGSMTPGSYSRWHHSRQQQLLRSDDPYQSYNGPGKRYNPLYDTPPSQRHALLQQQQQQQLFRQHEHLAFMGEIRGVMGTPPTAKNQLKQGVPNQVLQQRLRLPSNSRQSGHQRGGRLIEPVLSPILTDQELSPLHRPGHPDFLTDQSESENEEDQATQGYSEGLADNEQDEEESEVSSLFGGQDLENLGSPALTGLNGVSRPKRPAQPQQNPISPLQYSAMLKLYSTSAEATAPRPEVGRKLSNSSATANANNAIKKKSSFEGKEYSRLGTSEIECGRVEPETVFSSSQSSAEDSDVQELSPPNTGKASNLKADVNMFRWDGSKISTEKTNDSDTKNANSGEIIFNEAQSKKSHQA